ncbi:MAG: hypothetical protein KC613_21765 [Myxococcales bacterium]|nr:hypothetical protein [Myxococcales bacterium]
MSLRTLAHGVALGLIAISLSGCFNAGVYRTARTLEPGVGDLNINFSVSKVNQTAEVSGESEEFDYTAFTILPEIGYHLGVMENLEIGGRVAPQNLFIELDAKYRFVGGPAEKLHVAIAPHVGYQTAIIADGPSVGVPLIVTYDVTKNLAINVAGFGRVLFLSETFDGGDDVDIALGGTTTTFGGHLGIELRGETFYFMPAVEYSRWMSTIEAEAEGEKVTTDYTTNVLQASVNFGFVFGREKQQLDRMENKIDKMDDKLDRALDK